jgi:hypothetical protein
MDWIRLAYIRNTKGMGHCLEEYDRQHLAEHHSGFIVRPLSMDHTDTNDPPTRLSGTMEPERRECDHPCHKISPGSVWIDCMQQASFCSWCGKPLVKEE